MNRCVIDVCIYVQTNVQLHLCVCVSIFMLFSLGEVQTEEVDKSKHCTITYSFLAAARTKQPQLEPVSV